VDTIRNIIVLLRSPEKTATIGGNMNGLPLYQAISQLGLAFSILSVVVAGLLSIFGHGPKWTLLRNIVLALALTGFVIASVAARREKNHVQLPYHPTIASALPISKGSIVEFALTTDIDPSMMGQIPLGYVTRVTTANHADVKIPRDTHILGEVGSNILGHIWRIESDDNTIKVIVSGSAVVEQAAPSPKPDRIPAGTRYTLTVQQ
jgi:hypothetical protein